jgi:ribosome-interacting GTPase 1
MILVVLDVQTYPIQQLEETFEILAENRIVPQHQQADHEVQHRKVFVPVLVLANKCDDESCDEVYDIFCELIEGDWPLLPISVISGKNFDQLKQRIFEQLEVMRVYTRAVGLEPDFSKPFVLKKGSTVTELASKIHKDFYNHLKSARVWGSSAFEGQMVQRDYILQDGDVVELRI